MKKVLELQQLNNEEQPEIGPTITTITVIPTTFISLLSNHCDNHAS
ncbi:class III lanthipeptide [Bacillus safensis]|nr:MULTISPECIES: class III lanthipeptide [Bacillus]MDR6749030.1 hypothetical protein [Bacillus pumilus]MCY7711174.1 class III lanthipeptide [Bacillus safensis]MCY7727962.1 class III lanthipeptide [Bacillus safensis]MCY7738452.1 class III lanthipeptide [Bacillus safensis]MED0884437.1 class III lanthipeptide [Bacillus safensis]